MNYNLYYINNKKEIYVERKLDKNEIKLIDECNHILENFDNFYDFYQLLKSSLDELINYINVAEKSEVSLLNSVKQRSTIIEINKKTINFAGMFKTYLDYYEAKVDEMYGNSSEEYKNYKSTCSKFFDNYFEYRFLYHFRHYSVHYAFPVTRMHQDLNDNRTVFYIEKERLKKWSRWNKKVLDDIEKLTQDIDLKLFINECEKMLKELNKDLSYFDNEKLLYAIRTLKKYEKLNETPCVGEEDDLQGKKPLGLNYILLEYRVAMKNIVDLAKDELNIF